MMRSVFMRCGKWLTVLALVLGIGGHWFLLQSAAWVGMAVTYSKSEPVSVALEKTFGGKFPCQLCKFVKEGKASEKKRDIPKFDPKLEFTFDAGTCGLFPPRPFRHFTPQSQRADVFAEAPLPPPPRAA